MHGAPCLQRTCIVSVWLHMVMKGIEAHTPMVDSPSSLVPWMGGSECFGGEELESIILGSAACFFF